MKQTLTQFSRYAVVGMVSNTIGYLLYIWLTHLGLGPKLAMSLLYGVGVLQTFLFNKRWTFENRGAHGLVFMRYCMTYGLGYLINLLVLFVFVDQLGCRHEFVQGIMILTLAIMLFLLQKYWVFHLTRNQEVPKFREATKS